MANILTYLERSSQRFPDKTAFADEQRALTFTQLADSAARVGASLLPRVARRGAVVFYGEKSARMLCGFLGAAMVGGFYVVLDPKHPPQRACAILESLGASFLVVEEAYYEKAVTTGFAGEILRLEPMLNTPVTPAQSDALAARRAQAIDTDPLYAMFTSGSTGAPKGVLVSHRSVTDFIDVFTDTFGITESDSLANQAPFDFDVSVKDIYTGLKTGATVHLIPRAFFSFPTKLMDFLCERKPTTLIWAVSALVFVTTMQALDYKVPTSVNKIMFSGEVMPAKHLTKLRAVLPNALYVNLYGPTEITCNCTYHILKRAYDDSEALPIGKAFANESVFLLDENDREVTANTPDARGEICVTGTALALGYYGDAQKTAQCFTQNPLNPAYPERMYRTGDLGYYGADGLLYYASRKDFQIKHLGHRIELGEIEAALHSVDGVERACCVYREDKQRIVAFHTGAADKKAIVAALRIVLPAYMLPNTLVALDEMPVTKNGKIDRAQLRQRALEI